MRVGSFIHHSVRRRRIIPASPFPQTPHGSCSRLRVTQGSRSPRGVHCSHFYFESSRRAGGACSLFCPPPEASDSPTGTCRTHRNSSPSFLSCFPILRSVTDAAHTPSKTSPPSWGWGSTGRCGRWRPSFLHFYPCRFFATWDGRNGILFFVLWIFWGWRFDCAVSVAEPRCAGHPCVG
jgi:hypothetical protein